MDKSSDLWLSCCFRENKSYQNSSSSSRGTLSPITAVATLNGNNHSSKYLSGTVISHYSWSVITRQSVSQSVTSVTLLLGRNELRHCTDLMRHFRVNLSFESWFAVMQHRSVGRSVGEESLSRANGKFINRLSVIQNICTGNQFPADYHRDHLKQHHITNWANVTHSANVTARQLGKIFAGLFSIGTNKINRFGNCDWLSYLWSLCCCSLNIYY